MERPALLPASLVVPNWKAGALMTAVREDLARALWDGVRRPMRWLRKLLRALAAASARLTRTLDRAANRLEDAERTAGVHACPLLPAEWIVDLEDNAVVTVDPAAARRPPPIPAEARRPATDRSAQGRAPGRAPFDEGPGPLVVAAPLMAPQSGSIAPPL
jgi:hypothetical protein